MSALQILLMIAGAIVSIVVAIITVYFKIVDKVDQKLDKSEARTAEREEARLKAESEERKLFTSKLDGFIQRLSDISSNLENYKDIKEVCFSRFDTITSDIGLLRKELEETNGRLNGHITDTNRHNSH